MSGRDVNAAFQAKLKARRDGTTKVETYGGGTPTEVDSRFKEKLRKHFEAQKAPAKAAEVPEEKPDQTTKKATKKAPAKAAEKS